jgi:hypothetical protein
MFEDGWRMVREWLRMDGGWFERSWRNYKGCVVDSRIIG